jgi:hypothetical protein
MPMIRVLALSLVLAVAVACGDDNPTPTTPTTPTPTTTTETFSDTLNVNGGRTHSFVTGQSGQISVTITELVPDSAAVIGVSLGTWNGATCQVVLANDNATQAAQVLGNAGAAGNFCARVYDVGKLTSSTGYTLTVVHF